MAQGTPQPHRPHCQQLMHAQHATRTHAGHAASSDASAAPRPRQVGAKGFGSIHIGLTSPIPPVLYPAETNIANMPSMPGRKGGLRSAAGVRVHSARDAMR